MRYNFGIQGLNPVDGTTYTYSASGVITFGTDGADDTYSSSFALRSLDNRARGDLVTFGMRRPRGSRPRA